MRALDHIRERVKGRALLLCHHKAGGRKALELLSVAVRMAVDMAENRVHPLCLDLRHYPVRPLLEFRLRLRHLIPVEVGKPYAAKLLLRGCRIRGIGEEAKSGLQKDHKKDQKEEKKQHAPEGAVLKAPSLPPIIILSDHILSFPPHSGISLPAGRSGEPRKKKALRRSRSLRHSRPHGLLPPSVDWSKGIGIIILQGGKEYFKLFLTLRFRNLSERKNQTAVSPQFFFASDFSCMEMDFKISSSVSLSGESSASGMEKSTSTMTPSA